jgi:hypothetical protein
MGRMPRRRRHRAEHRRLMARRKPLRTRGQITSRGEGQSTTTLLPVLQQEKERTFALSIPETTERRSEKAGLARCDRSHRQISQSLAHASWPRRWVRNNPLGRISPKPPRCSGSRTIQTFCHHRRQIRGAISCRQEIDGEKADTLSSYSQFRNNLLDNIPCLCGRLKGSGNAVAGKAPAVENLPASKMCLKTQVLRRDLKNLREIISYTMQSIYRQNRVRGSGEKRGSIKMPSRCAMLLKTQAERI